MSAKDISTPRPWWMARSGERFALGQGNQEIAWFGPEHMVCGEDQEHARQDALYARRAVNAHEALVEAVEGVLHWLIAAETELGRPLPLKYALRAALKKAKGG